MTLRRILRDDERRAWLRLARTETIGPTTFAALIARFGDVREALEAAPRLARHGGAKELRMPSETDARAEIEALARLGGRLLACIEPDFPSGLPALDPPPPIIAVPGDPAPFKPEMVAAVG